MKRMCLKSEVLRDPLGLWPPLDPTRLPPLTLGDGGLTHLPTLQGVSGEGSQVQRTPPMGESRAGGGEGGSAQHGWVPHGRRAVSEFVSN